MGVSFGFRKSMMGLVDVVWSGGVRIFMMADDFVITIKSPVPQ